MPRPFPVEFRRRAVALVCAGKHMPTAAVEPGVRAATIHNWGPAGPDRPGRTPGITTPRSIELAKAKQRIRLLELAHREIAAKPVNHSPQRAATTSATSSGERRSLS